MNIDKKEPFATDTAQDGACLAELLLDKGYEVTGTYRRTSSANFWGIEELGIQNHASLRLVECDHTDLSSSIRLLINGGFHPDTYLLATNRTEAVRDFVTMAFKVVGIAIEWQGSADQETGHDARTGKVLVRVSPKFYRPAEVELLIGDPAKVKAELGCEPKTTLEELCDLMVEADLCRNAAGFSF